eukprot:2567104-Prymnesium_polylepis.1
MRGDRGSRVSVHGIGRIEEEFLKVRVCEMATAVTGATCLMARASASEKCPSDSRHGESSHRSASCSVLACRDADENESASRVMSGDLVTVATDVALSADQEISRAEVGHVHSRVRWGERGCAALALHGRPGVLEPTGTGQAQVEPGSSTQPHARARNAGDKTEVRLIRNHKDGTQISRSRVSEGLADRSAQAARTG